jgi:TatD DNase family protein
MRFTHWYQNGPTRLQPGVKVDYASYLRAWAAGTPLELLLTETDSPFLTPHPFRGQPNDPSYVPHTLRALADVLGRDHEAVADAVERNAIRAFALPG